MADPGDSDRPDDDTPALLRLDGCSEKAEHQRETEPSGHHPQHRAFVALSTERSDHMIVDERLPRITTNPRPDGEHDDASRNCPDQERRLRPTESAALESNNVSASESGAAARHNRVTVDPIDHERHLLAMWGLDDDGVARFQGPEDWLTRSRLELNPLHARAARQQEAARQYRGEELVPSHRTRRGSELTPPASGPASA